MSATDSSKKPEANPIRSGHQLQGRYNLINRIAIGGMGEVWRARDSRTGTLVAAKVLRPELTGEEISLSRLRIEAKNATRAHHPNIAAVLDSGESDGQGWIVMELVQGDPLTDFVGDGRRLSAEELIPILSQTAFALDGAAQAGIIHRDIKPANIMVRPDGIVKLTDFGISYTDGQANLTAVGMVMGTAQYLAPEQAMGSVATHSGDLYSLGVIAYEALAGYRPFTGSSVVEIAMAHVNEDVPPLPDDVPEALAEVVYTLLEKEPENRPSSGTALVRILSRVAEELGTTTLPKPITRPQIESAPDTVPAEEKRVVGTQPQSHRPTRPPQPLSRRSRSTRSQKHLDKESSSWTGPEFLPGSIEPSTDAGPRPSSPSSAAWLPVKLESVSPASPSQAPKKRPSSSDSPQTPPSRADTRRRQDSSIDVGLWVIIALVALTIILIVVAMLREHPRTNADVSWDTHLSTSTLLEVEPWLMPNPNF